MQRGDTMRNTHIIILLILCTCLLSACANLPQVPTKTPTMNAEQMMQAAQETAEAMRAATETQWAIDNPSPTPTNTDTPTPEYTPTPAMPLIPPTATEEPLPYYRVSDYSSKIYEIGNPSNWSDFVPSMNLYIEICFKNGGSGEWNENFSVVCTNPNGYMVNPQRPEGVKLGKTVHTNEWACFSFNGTGSHNYALKTYCPGFQLYTDNGVAMARGYTSTCFTIH